MSAALQIRTILSAPFEENSYIVWLQGQSECVVFDPGLEPSLILELCQEESLTPVALLNTHGHADHIGGNAALKVAFPQAPLIIGQGDANMLTDPVANLSAAFGMPIVSPPADRTVVEGELLQVAGLSFLIREIPGHSPGHVVFIHGPKPLVVFGGDVLFRGGVGRTDFPGGSTQQLLQGIRDKLYTLPDDAVVYPGHGPVTTTGHEKRANPFVNQRE